MVDTLQIFSLISKAFDTVDHDILHAKLKTYCVKNLELFTLYRTTRKKFCKVSGLYSKTEDR